MQLTKNFLYFEFVFRYLNLFLSTIFSFLIIRILTSRISVDTYGNYSLIYSFSTLINILINFGIPNLATKIYLKLKTENKKSTFINSVLAIQLISFGILLLIFTIINTFFLNLNNLIYLAFIYSISSIFSFNWYYSLMRKFYIIIFKNLSLSFLTMTSYFFINDDNFIFFITFIFLLNIIVELTIFLLYFRKKITFKSINFDFLSQTLKYLFISINIFIFVNTDIFIISLLLDNYNVGIYAFAVKIFSFFKNVFAVIILSSQPKIQKLFSINNSSAVYFSKIVIKTITILLAAVIPFLILNSKKIILIFTNSSVYTEANISLIILFLALPFSILGWANNYLLQVNFNRERSILSSTFIASFFNLTFNLIFVSKFGIVAAALTTLIAEIIIFILSIIDLKSLNLIKFPHSKFFILIFINFFSIIFINLLLDIDFIFSVGLHIVLFFSVNFIYIFYFYKGYTHQLKEIIYE